MKLRKMLPTIMINAQQTRLYEIKCFGSVTSNRETFKMVRLRYNYNQAIKSSRLKGILSIELNFQIVNRGYTFFMMLRKMRE